MNHLFRRGWVLLFVKKILSKAAVDNLSILEISVDYNKKIMMETDMAKSVIKTITDNDGIYIPPGFLEK